MERPELWIGMVGTRAFTGRPIRKTMVPVIDTLGSKVDAFTITDKHLLLEYLDAVFARTKSCLSTISNADLNRVLNEPHYQPLPTLSVRLASVINCNTRHAGQIEYLRGLVKHQGWSPAAEK